MPEWIETNFFDRKRGGSVDNLLDDLAADEIGHHSGQQISADTKKKSVSSKNLSMGPMEEVKITTVWNVVCMIDANRMTLGAETHN